MEFDYKIILYIIFFVIYILAKTLKKPKPKHTPPKPRPNIDAEAHEAEPTMTFEGIFRELTVDKKKEKPAKVINEVEELESSYYPSDDEIQEVYKESLIQAEKSKTQEQIVRDNAKKKRTAPLKSEKFSAYEVKEITSLASELGEMLKNPEDARKAIVLKEILDRKY